MWPSTFQSPYKIPFIYWKNNGVTPKWLKYENKPKWYCDNNTNIIMTISKKMLSLIRCFIQQMRLLRFLWHSIYVWIIYLDVWCMVFMYAQWLIHFYAGNINYKNNHSISTTSSFFLCNVFQSGCTSRFRIISWFVCSAYAKSVR